MSRVRRLVVVSLDGMRPEAYRHPQNVGLKMPNLEELVAAGASADAVESIYPSTTYPAHATLATGVPPRVHGIYCHLASLDPTERARPWHWFARAIRVPAIWSVARATGLRTAAIGWPVSAGATIDFNVPEIWDPAAPNPLADFQTAARHSTPGLFEELLRELRPALEKASQDVLRTEAALYVWRKYRPNLMLLHLMEYDDAAHSHGPLAPEARAALERADALLGRLRDALSDARDAVVVVLSDHGFVPVQKDAAPLVALAQEGLFEKRNSEWELKRLGAVHAGGSFALYWLEEPGKDDRHALTRAVERLQKSGAVAEVVDRERLEELGADPDAEMILDAAPGYFFSDRFEGPLVETCAAERGTHGHLPTRAGLEAGFVAAGEGVARGKNLGLLTLMQVGRTLMELLGLPADVLATDEAALDLG